MRIRMSSIGTVALAGVLVAGGYIPSFGAKRVELPALPPMCGWCNVCMINQLFGHTYTSGSSGPNQGCSVPRFVRQFGVNSDAPS